MRAPRTKPEKQEIENSFLKNHDFSSARAQPIDLFLERLRIIVKIAQVMQTAAVKDANSASWQLILFRSMQATKSPYAASPIVPTTAIFVVPLAIGMLSIHHLMNRNSKKYMNKEYIIPIRKMIVYGYQSADSRMVACSTLVVAHFIRISLHRCPEHQGLGWLRSRSWLELQLLQCFHSSIINLQITSSQQSFQMNSNQEKAICPTCKESSSVIRIQYGKPAPQLIQAAKRGEVKLGGCSVESYRHFCKTCELKFK